MLIRLKDHTMKVTLIRSRAIDPSVNKIASTLHRTNSEVKLLLWDRSGNGSTDKINGYPVYRCGLKAPYDKLSAIFYLPIWMLYEFFFLLGDDSDVFHCCDFDTLWPAIIASKLKRRKLCYFIYDFYSDNLPSSVPSIIKKMVASMEKLGIGLADVLFLVDESRYGQVAGAKIPKLAYIYNTPPDTIQRKQIHDSHDEFRIFYAGVIHESRGFGYLLDAIKELDGVFLNVAGSGPEAHRFTNLNFDVAGKIAYLGQISYKEVLTRSLESDVLFAFYDPSLPNNRFASPNKLFEAMMCGKPIITNDDTSMADIVRKEGCGMVIPYGDAGAFVEVINKLKDDRELCHKLGQNGRNAYDNEYSWAIMERRLLDAYVGLYGDKNETT